MALLDPTLQPSWPPTSSWRLLKVRIPFCGIVSETISSYSHLSSFRSLRSPSFSLAQDLTGSSPLGNCKKLQLPKFLPRVDHCEGGYFPVVSLDRAPEPRPRPRPLPLFEVGVWEAYLSFSFSALSCNSATLSKMPCKAVTVGLGAPPTAPSSAMSTRVEVCALSKGNA